MRSFPEEAVLRVGSPDKPTVLFLHGFLGRKEDWSDVIANLTSGFAAIAVDLPGHGRNHPKDDSAYSMSGCAEAIIALLDEMKIATVGLVGYSMGGRLALYLAIHHPDRFSRVLIESASPGLRTSSERKARIEQDKELAARIESRPMAEFVSDWYRLPLFAGLQNHPKKLQKLIADRSSNLPSGLIRSLTGMGTGAQPSLWKSVADISISLWIVAGGEDSKFASIGKEMADLCPRATLCILEGSSHLAHSERQDAFVTQLNLFLE